MFISREPGHKPSSAIVWARLPRAGLGNILLVWAQALVFARLKGLPLVTSGWGQIYVGPVLRRERHRRYYGRYFASLDSIPAKQKLLSLFSHRRIHEPDVRKASEYPVDGRLYIFTRVPHWSDPFGQIRDQRELVRASLRQMIRPHLHEQLARLERPWVGVHIRMGDFRPLQPGEDFSKVGIVRTPLSYFSELIAGIRSIHGTDLPVMVFSDGHDDELREILQLPNVRRASRQADVLDLLLLAQSRLVIASAGSTFSYWGGFLADAPLLLHPDHIHAPLRTVAVNSLHFEGGVRGPAAEWPALLKRNILAIGN